MILQNLRLENFFTYKEANVPLGPYKFFVSGENRDEHSASSNGAGKSLLCQAIVYCLFDDLIRSTQLKKDDVIGPHGPYALVEVELEKDGQHIRVMRCRNHPEFKNGAHIWVDGQNQDDHKNTDARIQEILGLNSKTIYHAAYNDPYREPLVNLTSAKMKESVSEILGTERFDVYVKKTNSETSDNASKIKLLENSILNTQTHIADKEESHKKLLDSIANESKDREAVHQSMVKRIEDYEKTIVEYQAKLEGREKFDTKLSNLEEKLKDFAPLNASSKKVTQAIQDATAKVTNIEKRIQKHQAEYNSLKEKLNNLENNPTGQCNYCGNALSNSEHLVEMMKKGQDELDYTFLEMTKHTPGLEKSQAEVKALKTEALDIQHRLENFTSLLESKKKLETYVNALNTIEGKIRETERDIKSIRERILANQSRKPPIEAEESIRVSLENSRRILKEGMEELVLLKQKAADFAVLKECLTTMKVGVFNSFIKDLWEQIGDCLEDLTEGDYSVTLETKKDELQFLFSSVSKGDKYLHYSLFSTGEQKRISKAVSTALEEVLDIGFVIDDEACVFIDPAGIPKMLDFTVRRNEGKTLFFVGLTPELKDYFTGERNLHVIKENGISRVELRTV
jgi:DNA repair exonuclease SbcCD ATPase subunit